MHLSVALYLIVKKIIIAHRGTLSYIFRTLTLVALMFVLVAAVACYVLWRLKARIDAAVQRRLRVVFQVDAGRRNIFKGP